jgi:hypothetical protein
LTLHVKAIRSASGSGATGLAELRRAFGLPEAT